MELARPAGPDDVARLVELCDEALAEASARRGGGLLVRSSLRGRSVSDRLAEAMADRDGHVVVGELAGAAMGVGVVEVPRPRTSAPAEPAGALAEQASAPAAATAEVVVLFVEPGCRSVGLGEAMMDAMTTWAQQHGCTGIDAIALPGSREAKSFFETHGLVARALVMHRSLVSAPPAPVADR